jgi:hypothetical protein
LVHPALHPHKRAKRIERFAPELDGIVSIDESINQLAGDVGGDGGDGGPAEGPVWWKEGGYLLVTELVPVV